jgi:hypothetical protein
MTCPTPGTGMAAPDAGAWGGRPADWACTETDRLSGLHRTPAGTTPEKTAVPT